ncbi:MAG: lipid-binding SYLF domain-containing protein [Desulfobacterales bacterium]|nr:lipid-binding SYLF domain-containing protein [Desulfobacterales bacterium]
MKMKKLSLVLIFSLILGMSAISVAAEGKDYSATIEMFKESPAVAKFFENSYGYAVFPAIGKGGWIVGAGYGEGYVFRNGEITGWASVAEVSIGLQIGGQAFSEIIFFQDKQAYDKFTSGSFELSASAQAVVVTAGAQARTGTSGSGAGATAGPKTGVQAEIGYVNGLAVFLRPLGGLMFDASIGGQSFQFTPY